jgi:hypothetical protein
MLDLDNMVAQEHMTHTVEWNTMEVLMILTPVVMILMVDMVLAT